MVTLNLNLCGHMGVDFVMGILRIMICVVFLIKLMNNPALPNKSGVFMLQWNAGKVDWLLIVGKQMAWRNHCCFLNSGIQGAHTHLMTCKHLSTFCLLRPQICQTRFYESSRQISSLDTSWSGRTQQRRRWWLRLSGSLPWLQPQMLILCVKCLSHPRVSSNRGGCQTSCLN